MSPDRPLNAYQKLLRQRESLQVLVVDDMASSRALVKSILKHLGIPNVVEAANGFEAIKHLSNSRVDLLICDWNMPGMTGLEVLIQAREQLNLKTLPVIMVTAERNQTQVRDALAAGVTSYVLKPFMPTTLIGHINRCLARVGEDQSGDP